MSNVISFAARRGDSVTGAHEPADTGVSETSSRLIGLQSKATAEIWNSILTLDRALQYARSIVTSIPDPLIERTFEPQIKTLEKFLQIARTRAMKL